MPQKGLLTSTSSNPYWAYHYTIGDDKVETVHLNDIQEKTKAREYMYMEKLSVLRSSACNFTTKSFKALHGNVDVFVQVFMYIGKLGQFMISVIPFALIELHRL